MLDIQTPISFTTTHLNGYWKTIDEIMRIKNTSSSHMNFAANINRRMFSITESNVRRSWPRESIKDLTFRLFPLESKAMEKTSWNACITAIDEASRRLNASKKWLVYFFSALILYSSHCTFWNLCVVIFWHPLHLYGQSDIRTCRPYSGCLHVTL